MNLLQTQNKYSNWLEIDLVNLSNNYKVLKKYLTSGTQIALIVKANAYGHGVNEVVGTAVKQGISFFGVATIQEAVELREKFPSIKILVLDANFPSDAPVIVEYNLTPLIYSLEMLDALYEAAKQFNKSINVHIKIDTGMGRVGVWHTEAVDFILRAIHYGTIKVEGLCSHFSMAESDFSYSLQQWEAFSEIIDRAKQFGVMFRYYHISNSAGTFLSGLPYFNFVRTGIMSYGIMPRKNLLNTWGLKPVMSWRSKVIYCKDVKVGRYIGYGCTYRVGSDTKIVTIPIGYADGYMRSLSNKGVVLIKGKRYPVVGRVAMDHMMVDVGPYADLAVGDEVTLIGSQGNERISSEELSELAGTIPYEITCNAGKRTERTFLRSVQ